MNEPGVWIFGYGSLVDPVSFGATLGRPVIHGVDCFAAELSGYERRWNYGVLHATGRSPAGEHTIVALGIVPAPGATVNGVVAWVADHELAALDRRERHYDRVVVTSRVTSRVTAEAACPDGEVAVYVPRREPISHYEDARRRGAAAIEQRYWDLVERAFEALGDDHHARYLATTAPPDIPVLPLER